jgi:hypothetical protein
MYDIIIINKNRGYKMHRKIMPLIVIFSMICFGCVQLTSPVAAFTGGNHTEINDQTLPGAGFSKDAQEKINEENLKVDQEDSTGIGTATGKYRPEHHSDRNGPNTPEANKEAFQKMADYVRALKKAIIAAILRCDRAGVEAALVLIGKATHAIQDFYSHSNFVDLNPEDQKKVREAFDNPNGAIPDGLKLTGYDPKTGNPYRAFNPKGDNYEHGLIFGNNKDWGGAAKQPKEAAQKHTREFLDELLKAVGKEKWTEKFTNYHKIEIKKNTDLRELTPRRIKKRVMMVPDKKVIVAKTLRELPISPNSLVMKDSIINVSDNGNIRPEPVRMITFRNLQGKEIVILTNDLQIEAKHLVSLYNYSYKQ